MVASLLASPSHHAVKVRSMSERLNPCTHIVAVRSCTCLPDLCWCVSISVTFAASIHAARVRVSRSLPHASLPAQRRGAAWIGPHAVGRARGAVSMRRLNPFPRKATSCRARPWPTATPSSRLGTSAGTCGEPKLGLPARSCIPRH